MSFPGQGVYQRSPLEVVHYGARSIVTGLPDVLSRFGTKKVVILTGKSLSKTALVPRLKELLGDKFVGINTGIGEHAPVAGIRAASTDVEALDADTIIAFGGGSPIDSAKAVKYLLHEAGKPWLKVIAIPTTLSNAETTANAGYTNDEGHKVVMSNYELCPNAIIYDAELSLDTPERLWLSSGMRAVDHSVETMYRSNITAPVMAAVFSALPLLFQYLVESKQDPKSIHAREQLQIATWLSLYPAPGSAGRGFLSHGLGHALGATYGIPHGITSCLTLAACVARIARKADPVYQAVLSRGLKIVELSVTNLTPPTTRFSKPGDDKLPLAAQDGIKLAGYIDALVDTIGLHSRLRDYGIKKEQFESIVTNGHADTNPHVSKEEVLELMEDIW